MSSFRVISKKTRLKIGIGVVIIIHIGMFYGFWHVKAGQIGNKVYEMDIYAATSTEGLTFYEALPSAECVKVLNEQAPKPGMPVYAEPPADVKAGDSASNKDTKVTEVGKEATANVADANVDVKPKEVKFEPPLTYATAPRCKGIASVPAGADKLGADGFVGLELNIDKAGLVKHGEVSRSSGFAELDEAALKQVKENLSFKPCQKGDVSVGCKQIIKYRWKTQ